MDKRTKKIRHDHTDKLSCSILRKALKDIELHMLSEPKCIHCHCSTKEREQR